MFFIIFLAFVDFFFFIFFVFVFSQFRMGSFFSYLNPFSYFQETILPGTPLVPEEEKEDPQTTISFVRTKFKFSHRFHNKIGIKNDTDTTLYAFYSTNDYRSILTDLKDMEASETTEDFQITLKQLKELSKEMITIKPHGKVTLHHDKAFVILLYEIPKKKTKSPFVIDFTRTWPKGKQIIVKADDLKYNLTIKMMHRSFDRIATGNSLINAFHTRLGIVTEADVFVLADASAFHKKCGELQEAHIPYYPVARFYVGAGLVIQKAN